MSAETSDRSTDGTTEPATNAAPTVAGSAEQNTSHANPAASNEPQTLDQDAAEQAMVERMRPKTPAHESAAIRTWLRDHRIEEVECAVPDLAGVARGKVMPAEKFADLRPTYLPVSIFWQTITGGYAEIEDEMLYTEGDMLLVPDIGTIRSAPWASSPTGQVIHDVVWHDGEEVPYAPRNVLKRVMRAYEAKGWKPIVAPELEFFLTKPNPDPDYPLESPVGRSGRQGAGGQSYSLSAVDEYDKVIDDMYDFAEEMELEIDTIIQESGAAQLEINLLHGDALELADQAFLFKRLIREAAFRHGCYATFMAKPMEREPGSAAHIHQSVVDAKTGRTLFSGPDGSPSSAFYAFLAGQQTYLPQASCLLAPYVNSYRRLVPDDAAPINLEWGVDNRSTGLRVPVSSPTARRVENRIAGADVNPYLAIAASLACGYLGMVEELTPRDAIAGNAYAADRGLPHDLLEALTLFEGATELRSLLGNRFTDIYLEVKREEFAAFMRVISPWEREHLLLNV